MYFRTQLRIKSTKTRTLLKENDMCAWCIGSRIPCLKCGVCVCVCQGLVLLPNCVPQKVSVNKKRENEK
jgi:hypothetical protein